MKSVDVSENTTPRRQWRTAKIRASVIGHRGQCTFHGAAVCRADHCLYVLDVEALTDGYFCRP